MAFNEGAGSVPLSPPRQAHTQISHSPSPLVQIAGHHHLIRVLASAQVLFSSYSACMQ